MRLRRELIAYAVATAAVVALVVVVAKSDNDSDGTPTATSLTETGMSTAGSPDLVTPTDDTSDLVTEPAPMVSDPATTASQSTTGVPPATESAPAGSAPTEPVPADSGPAAGPATEPTVPVPSGSGVLWSEGFSTVAGMDRLVQQVTDGVTAINVKVGAEGSNGHVPVTFEGDHDHSCGLPSTTRTLVEDHTPATHVWWCAPKGAESGHFMTGVNTTSYVVVAFSPKGEDGQAAVFPESANRICWDQNLTYLGGRKWTQLAVVAAPRFVANGRSLIYISPDFSGNANPANLAFAGGADDFIMVNTFNMATMFVGASKTTEDFSHVFVGLGDKAARYRMCAIDNGDGTVTRTQARPDGVMDVVTGPGRFPAGPRVFVLSDDSYNPDKFWEGRTDAPPVSPYTWHWDNISIETS